MDNVEVFSIKTDEERRATIIDFNNLCKNNLDMKRTSDNYTSNLDKIEECIVVAYPSIPKYNYVTSEEEYPDLSLHNIGKPSFEGVKKKLGIISDEEQLSTEESISLEPAQSNYEGVMEAPEVLHHRKAA